MARLSILNYVYTKHIVNVKANLLYHAYGRYNSIFFREYTFGVVGVSQTHFAF